MTVVKQFSDIGIGDIPLVGGKNASLGQMISELSVLGVRVPDGFAITTDGYRQFLSANHLEAEIRDRLASASDVDSLTDNAKQIRRRIAHGAMPESMSADISAAYRALVGDDGFVAVRSSATAEDLPTASFAGQQESFLHIHGEAELLDAVKRCFASLFTARAISYRRDMGIADDGIALSVGVQRMVVADRACSGVIFTLEPDSGHRDFILVTSAWGLGENVVQGKVEPDEFWVHKPTLKSGFDSIVRRHLGSKELTLAYDHGKGRLENEETPAPRRRQSSLDDREILELARWSATIEDHYSEQRGEATPMDLEWAKDADSGKLYIVQARPETVHSQRQRNRHSLFHLDTDAKPLASGIAIGTAIGSGTARIISSPEKIAEFRPGEVLITDTTDPDWEPIMKIASAIVTERGGRTSHAAIVAREMAIPAVVGAADAMSLLPAGESLTVSCASGPVGQVYGGELPYHEETIDADSLPATKTRIMLNLAQPDLALGLAGLPVDGVGLARMEFIFAGWVGVHPLALTRFDSLDFETQRAVDDHIGGTRDRVEFFIDRLSQGIATLAAAFYPRPVILRFSDFKSNEYAHLVGGAPFEPAEKNPMLGWRGASRYYHEGYKDGFLLEIAAVRRVREMMGLTNLKVMIPFCRTPKEGEKVLEALAAGGLRRGVDGLEVYMMAEIPSNIFLADAFADLFDGFSIGSNDLTQLCLGVDRDSERIAPLFDERNEAIKRACLMLLQIAHAAGKPVGICGQAPSDYPEFAAFLVEHGIDSLSLSPDAVVSARKHVAEIESRIAS